MKPWQKGYELDFLKEKAARFKDYNVFSLSPFSEINPMEMMHPSEAQHYKCEPIECSVKSSKTNPNSIPIHPHCSTLEPNGNTTTLSP